MAKKICPGCQGQFQCLDSDRCWCWNSEYAKFLVRIPQGLEGCLCEHCLTSLPEKKPIVKKKQEYVAGSNVAGVGP